MSRSLPPEILDLTIDHLHDGPATLKACCLVSKSWIPRARQHLFTHAKFDELVSPIESWMKAFPDPSRSPAHHTRTLTILGLRLITAASTDVGRWIRAFHSVVILHLDTRGWGENWGNDNRVSLLPFHGISPAVRSLHLESTLAPPSEIFSLMCSFPLLEDFVLVAFGPEDEADEWTAPSTSPRFTGTLGLSGMVGGVGPTARRLLDLPNGLHFTKIVLACVDEADPKSATDLVSRCSDTLESLDVTDHLTGEWCSTRA